MYLNPFTILPIFCMTLSLAVSVFVLLNNHRSDINRIFSAFCLTITFWFSYYILPNLKLPEDQYIHYVRIIYAGITFVPIMAFTFVTKFLNMEKFKRWFIVNIIIGLLIVFLTIFTNLIISKVIYYPWYPYPKAGPLHCVFLAHALYLITYMIIILNKAERIYAHAPKLLNQTQYVRAACFTLSIGTIDFLPNYNIPIYPIGYIPATACLLIFSYAILKYELLDIKIVIRKSLIYSIFISLITIIFSISVIIFEHLSEHYFGYKSILASIISSFIIAVLILPLRNKIQTCVDRIFFRGTQFEIIEENLKLRQELIHTEKMKAIAMIASTLAHEIKNPITAIKTFTEYLPQKRNDDKFIEQYSQIVGQEATRINDLIHELLVFSKPSELKFESINPKSLIESLIRLLSPQITKANIKTNINLNDSPARIQADPSQLKQALMNIIINAIHAMSDGGTLNVITRGEAKNQAFIIEISDTGCGIDPKDLPYIFDPFFTKKEKGTGLGLAITQGIIEKHGGRIAVESKINQGTKFTIKLPLI